MMQLPLTRDAGTGVASCQGMLAKMLTAAIRGVDAYLVTVEVDARRAGLPGFNLVGLPSVRVSEGKVRVKAALMNAGFVTEARRVTVNLAPAELRKDSSSFDLPVALCILGAFEQLPASSLEGVMALGELALDGSIRRVNGVLPAVAMAKTEGVSQVIVPEGSGGEAALVKDLDVRTARNIGEVVAHLVGGPALPRAERPPLETLALAQTESDLAEVRGQLLPRRALEIAAAGGHSLLMVGPPGTGKSMLARRLPGILPPLGFEEAMEASRIYSVAGLLNGQPLIRARPFRAPHHTISQVGLVGGGPNLRPGELSLAHRGVLFLDELAEFPRATLETLRQPLEERRITITRARGSVRLPADVQLVAALNPCPCGHFGDPRRTCVCSPTQSRNYWARISGPLLDRIDLQVEVPAVPFGDLVSAPAAEPSSQVAARVAAARRRQEERLGPEVGMNARMGPALAKSHCSLDADGTSFLSRAVERLGLSARAVERTLKVARTIADLSGSSQVRRRDLQEAVAFREVRRPD
ncbi:MAG: YifB family Mg chelatase-like AAA ATPase [Polyangia bacterium]|jgi:magnesium chelatase family protein|nr:YifB family Mg chelatase-like AAA ATPase [Polyangia bacterium]